jgi:hypothetical protein
MMQTYTPITHRKGAKGAENNYTFASFAVKQKDHSSAAAFQERPQAYLAVTCCSYEPGAPVARIIVSKPDRFGRKTGAPRSVMQRLLVLMVWLSLVYLPRQLLIDMKRSTVGKGRQSVA